MRLTRVQQQARTRAAVLAAASAEFAEHGFAGARIERIAALAPSNQRMIYAYFENKAGLFAAVIDEHVARAQQAVQLDVNDLPGYAVAVFDFYAAHPELARLSLWQELELREGVSTLPGARDATKAKIAAICAAQRRNIVNDKLTATELLDQIQAIAFGNLVGHGFDWSPKRREQIADSVRRLSRPRDI